MDKLIYICYLLVTIGLGLTLDHSSLAFWVYLSASTLAAIGLYICIVQVLRVLLAEIKTTI